MGVHTVKRMPWLLIFLFVCLFVFVMFPFDFVLSDWASKGEDRTKGDWR